jgi:predicted membrane protein
MEPYNRNLRDENKNNENRGIGGRTLGGIVIVAIGTLLLARQLDVPLPYWLFRWEMILIAVGIFAGVSSGFRKASWLWPVAIGGIFLLDDLYPDLIEATYLWPLIIIIVGLVMIFRPRRDKSKASLWGNATDETVTTDQPLDLSAIFGGIKKNFITKDFKGGRITSVFGGTEINLSQADIQGSVVLDITNIFGGTSLIIPSHWTLQSQGLLTILGGLDDNRQIVGVQPDPEKVLIIKGSCILGGIEIKSYK